MKRKGSHGRPVLYRTRAERLEARRKQNKQWRLQNLQKSKAGSVNNCLKQRYGISLEDYARLYSAQDGVCAVCRQPETAKLNGQLKMLAVDHSHTTGQVRGLLCARCNLALALVENEPDLVSRLQRYAMPEDRILAVVLQE